MDNETERSKKKNYFGRSLLGFGVGVLVTPPALFWAALSGGAGHGHYTAARALYSIPMLFTLNRGIGIVAIVLACVQFPVYGALLMRFFRTRGGWWVVAAIALMHGIAAIACFSGAIPNFS